MEKEEILPEINSKINEREFSLKLIENVLNSEIIKLRDKAKIIQNIPLRQIASNYYIKERQNLYRLDYTVNFVCVGFSVNNTILIFSKKTAKQLKKAMIAVTTRIWNELVNSLEGLNLEDIDTFELADMVKTFGFNNIAISDVSDFIEKYYPELKKKIKRKYVNGSRLSMSDRTNKKII